MDDTVPWAAASGQSGSHILGDLDSTCLLCPFWDFTCSKGSQSKWIYSGQKDFETLVCNDFYWAPKLSPPNCWMGDNFEETAPLLSLPCLTHPLLASARKKVWIEWTSSLTLHMEGENFVFIPACSWGMPVSRLLWPLWSCAFTRPHTLLSPVLSTVFTSSQ